MVNYQCQRCGYETNHKSVFRKHLLRKNLCNVKLKEMTRIELLEFYGFDEDVKMFDRSTESNSKKSSISNSFLCKFCNKKYKYKQGRWKHEQSCSKKDTINNQISQKILERLEALEKENKELREQLKLSSKPNINRGTINNATNQKIININTFGKENLDYLTEKVFLKLLNTPFNAIPKLIELKHFNPKHPENNNVKITNIHDKYAKVYKDKNWITTHKKEVINDMIDNGFADFEEFRDLNEDELAEKVREKYKLMEKFYNKQNKQLQEQVLMKSVDGTNSINDIVV
tara:strand:+ start:1092 stop:1952 length:861 start_codon:yes stop_codon:yes gene_type:complete